MNIVAIVGNVASEPELRHTTKGRALCSFRVAVARPGEDASADFFEVVAWERQAEICHQYLTLGRRVAVQGRLHSRVSNASDEVQRTSVELVAYRVEMLGRTSSVAAEAAEAVR